MKMSVEAFFQFLRFSLGQTEKEPSLEAADWLQLYEMSKKQTLLGVALDGISRMQQTRPPKDLLLKWIGQVKVIENYNIRMNGVIAEIGKKFEQRGIRICLLKGQGNALLYPEPLHRMAGDIDLWLSGRPKNIIRFVRKLSPKEKASYHHIEFPPYKAFSVEAHYRPCYLHNFAHNYRLQRFFKEHSEECFANTTAWGNTAVAVPTAEINIVFQLAHIFNHLFQEGIGLRQLMDYFFLMKRLELTVDERIKMGRQLRRMGLLRFAGAVMYVLHVALGLEEDKCIVPVDEAHGRFLLEEILRGGNFGRYDDRYAHRAGGLSHNWRRFVRTYRLLKYYPSEALCEPLFRLWHWGWRVVHN